MQRLIIVICFVLIFISTVWADRSITFPYTEDFSGSNSLSGISWAVNGATINRVQDSWRGGGNYAAKLTPPTSLYPGGSNGGYSALGKFNFPNTTTINIAFAIKIGISYDGTAVNGGGGLQNKFLDVSGSPARTGLLCLNNRANPHFAWALWQIPSGVQYYYDGRTTTGIDDFGASSGQLIFYDGNGGSLDYAGRWLWVNYILTTTEQELHIWDREGNYEGLYFKIPNSVIYHNSFYVGGYYNHYHPRADANTYIMLDDLQVTNRTTPQSPPEGFITNGEEPSSSPQAPSGLQIVGNGNVN